jgi:hypothetical protein
MMGTARLYDAEAGKELQSFIKEPARIGSIDLSEDGERALIIYPLDFKRGPGKVFVWDTTTGKELASLVGEPKLRIISARFFPDSRRVLVSKVGHVPGRGGLWLWDPEKGTVQPYLTSGQAGFFDSMGAEMTKVEVIALKRNGAEWKMVLPEVVRIMAETFGRAGQNTQKSGPDTDRADPDE